ncbi:SAM-dependent methyltransferase [Pelagibius marinus]|uniref:SAM-dependent methyltransferase n=1 Tax=Pelagibius marinus TaxID=2762760 RepID=UPI0018727162|nr:class I SAM-dependent methyltransferase [Pelagibius marinus]
MQRPMSLSVEEQAQRQRLEERYLWACAPVMLAIERRVCGCDYGGTSWTTRSEADRMAARLALRPGVRLLDLGAGSGWPGLYLAATTGCDATLVDLPVNGLKIARDRAREDGLASRVRAMVADAAALPFAEGAFDAISHSDLLCCLKQKGEVLAACRRAVRDGGRMVFTVISVAPDLPPARYRLAVARGPEFLETDSDYPALLAEAGWAVVESDDITSDYVGSCRRQLDADMTQKEPLTALIGAEEFDQRLTDWQGKLAALDDGLLRRRFFVAAPA